MANVATMGGHIGGHELVISGVLFTLATGYVSGMVRVLRTTARPRA